MGKRTKRDTGWKRGTGAWAPAREREVGGWILTVDSEYGSRYPGQREAFFKWTALGPNGERLSGNVDDVVCDRRITVAQDRAYAATGLPR